MHLRSLLIVGGLILGVAVIAPQAQAAKGVKKKGDHWVHGTVIHVEHRVGEVTVKVHHAKKKVAVIAGHPAVTHQDRFLVTQQTQLFVKQGQVEQPTTFLAVRVGEHVSILAKGHHAEKVVIHHHLKKPVRVGRKVIKGVVK